MNSEIAIIVAVIALCGVIITVIFNISNTRKQLFINTVTSSRIKWMGELKELVTEFVTLVSFHDFKNVEVGEHRARHLDKVISTKIRIKLQLNYRGTKDKEIINVIERLQVNYFDLYSKFTLIEKTSEEREISFLGSNQKMMLKELESRVHELDGKSGKELDDAIKELSIDVYNKQVKTLNKEFLKNLTNTKIDIINDTEKLVILTQEYLKEEWNRVKAEADNGNLSRHFWKEADY
ncbi:hypothetical protein [Paenibacillus sp. GbtcB18]|uniref:hypothetical protein n=1 Tax=Paenibacillus sp. GbtcB18 TaxID=2824763 RepID=UPI001C3102EC|nr:hypothetical protein [Paenibacillus sp. GbtcB18]